MRRRDLVVHGVRLNPFAIRILIALDSILRLRRAEVVPIPRSSCGAYRELQEAGLVVLGRYDDGKPIVALQPAGLSLALQLRTEVPA